MPKPQTEVNWPALRALAESGIPLRQLARRLNVPAGTVLARSKREAWQIKKIQAPLKAEKAQAIKNANAITAKTLAAGRDYLRDLSTLSRVNQAKACAVASSHFANMNGQQLEEKALPWSASVKNTERVFGWNQQPENQTQLTVNVALLSLTPFEFFCFNDLANQGKLPLDFPPERIHLAIDALPIDERSRLSQAFAQSPFAAVRDFPS